MNTPPQTLEDEALRDIEKPENPLKRYSVEFPYTCSFTIPDDAYTTIYNIFNTLNYNIFNTLKKLYKISIHNQSRAASPTSLHRSRPWYHSRS